MTGWRNVRRRWRSEQERQATGMGYEGIRGRTGARAWEVIHIYTGSFTPSPDPTPFYRRLISTRKGGLTTNGIHLLIPASLSNRSGPPQSWSDLSRRRTESDPEVRTPGHVGLQLVPSGTLSSPGSTVLRHTDRGPAATRVLPAAIGSRAASDSNLMAPSTRTRKSALIQHSPRFTT